MAREILGNLFISYCHNDKSYMRIFRKHLQGMLFNKIQVSSDEDIIKGTDWDTFLRGNLNQASSALILATPHYLISSWCRKELQQLAAAQRGRRLRNLFWVQLKSCGWQHTELSKLQSFDSNIELSVDDQPDETNKQRTVLQLCEQIVSEILRSTTDQDAQLAFVRRCLLEVTDEQNLTVNDVLSVSPFSVVCKGLSGSNIVAVKVLKWVPLETITADLLRVGKKRMGLIDPSFLRLYDIFQTGADDERRTILVSEYTGKDTLLRTILQKDGPFPIDKTVHLLRRMAEGLARLHGLSGGADSQVTGDQRNEGEWENAIGLLTPSDIYYDEVDERFRIPPIGISSFLWNILDCTMYETWVDSKGKIYVAPEQRTGRLTTQTDQYMLGRLCIELLEGLPFEQILNRGPTLTVVDDFWDNPQKFLKLSWSDNHKQLWSIVERMIQRNPSNRYKKMSDVVKDLFTVEKEDRALAKRVYQNHSNKMDSNIQFFKQFYEEFFNRSPLSKGKFKNQEQQHEKLMASMIAVLNFSPGNEPTSLDNFLKVHKALDISKEEFEAFHDSFLVTLDRFFGDDPKIRKAWDDLFRPVTDYMIAACVKPSAKGNAE